MNVSPIGQQNQTTSINFQRRKIPRYLYHLTSKKKYEHIMEDGFLRQSEEDAFTEGVFTIELSNFFKRWRSSSDWSSSSLQDRLVRHATGWKDNLVILKIPTENLLRDKLTIRSQNKLIGRDHYICDIAKREQTDRKTLKKFSDLMEHLLGKTPVTESKKFKNRKEALEYIYKADIPVNNLSKIGEVNIQNLKNSSEYDPNHKIHSIFTQLLKGQPEIKGAELLNI